MDDAPSAKDGPLTTLTPDYVLSYEAFPHLVETILSFASRPTLLTCRLVSSPIRARVDTLLSRHVEVLVYSEGLCHFRDGSLAQPSIIAHRLPVAFGRKILLLPTWLDDSDSEAEVPEAGVPDAQFWAVEEDAEWLRQLLSNADLVTIGGLDEVEDVETAAAPSDLDIDPDSDEWSKTLLGIAAVESFAVKALRSFGDIWFPRLFPISAANLEYTVAITKYFPWACNQHGVPPGTERLSFHVLLPMNIGSTPDTHTEQLSVWAFDYPESLERITVVIELTEAEGDSTTFFLAHFLREIWHKKADTIKLSLHADERTYPDGRRTSEILKAHFGALPAADRESEVGEELERMISKLVISQ